MATPVDSPLPPTVPTDEQVMDALEDVSETLGRPKVLQALKANNNWALSDGRLRRIILARNEARLQRETALPEVKDSMTALVEFIQTTSSVSPVDMMEVYNKHPQFHQHRDVDKQVIPKDTSALPVPVIPQNALAAQLRFLEDSTRNFILYGRGEYDYAVTPNSCVVFLLQICRDALLPFVKDQPRPLSVENQSALISNANAKLHALFEYYEAAGKKACIPAEDVFRQFEAEWGVNPAELRTEKERDPQYRAFYDEYKEVLHMAAVRPLYAAQYMATPDVFASFFKIGADGMPEYDRKKHGRFTLIITKIDKQTGQECGNL